ncbi:ABC transporter substrate-binding protein [Leifsonia shinshuensis]|uniref:ABC transporter substrate-binding protein n=1 Tax=Leifsonia shinshuensis TaxID=150026 RepID=A0A7G6Y9Q0_9MICO|nr:ABC transporter substrate-binding protein [Leifsonia shinshuensis]QNE35215.1 ABC transporter substrate-binding protein [Leifsonia shinshuensis]
MRTSLRTAAVLALAAATAALTGCAASAASADAAPATTIRVGYFDNVTHAPALVGIHDGLLQDALGKTKLQTTQFNAGPAEIEALSAGAIDAAYIGPSPAINSYLKSAGQSLRIVSGVATGGAALVVKSTITSPGQLRGKTIATPQLGNTQDVALRYWLTKQGLRTSLTGGGDVTVSPTDNAQALTLFQAGKIDGAWVPEPWVSRFVLDGNASVLVDETSLWPGGTFPTTVLAVSTAFLKAHPQTVKALVKGNADAVAALKDPATVGNDINAQLKTDTGKELPTGVLVRALDHVAFDTDPDAGAFPTLVAHANAVGLATKGSLKGLFDLTALNTVRSAAGQPAASAGGLG